MLPFKKRKSGAASYIIKRMKGSDSYENMKHHNESGKELIVKRSEVESDYSDGKKQCCHDMMSALERKDAQAFESSLKSYISMILDEREQDEEMEENDDYNM